jgi:dTDP-4-dehydrorhamnose reductase
MKVLVIGATGTIGKGVTELFKQKGYEVIEASRNSNPAVDITNAATIDELYSHVGEVNAIITTAGSAAFVPAETN